MADTDDTNQLEHLLAEIKNLAKPRLLGDFIQDATGLFIPGFTALPAVSILSNRSWKMKIKPEVERWRTGDLIALRSSSSPDESPKLLTSFFTPLGDITIPLIDITPSRDVSRYEKILRLKPKDRWESCEIYFSFLPWDAEREKRVWSSHELLGMSRVLEWLIRRLVVTMKIGDQEVPLNPQWGFSSWVPEPSIESIRFPINYCAKIISPFIFRLPISPSQTMPDGRLLGLRTETVELRFQFPEDALSELYREAGLGGSDISGISIFGNALPIFNVDLKAWELHDSFAECVRTAGMKPLGVAGIFPYVKAGGVSTERIEPISSYDNLFSLEVDTNGMVLSHYDIPGQEDVGKTTQLFLWMTHGEDLNGMDFRYYDHDVIQPMQRRSILLNQTFTIMPLFGGYDCRHTREDDWYKKILLNYSTSQNALLYPDALAHMVEDLLKRFGYRDISIKAPVTELRIIDGNRKRVSVVYLDNRSGKSIEPRHIDIIQGFINDRVPLGVQIILDVA
jgi:hypothetical protein